MIGFWVDEAGAFGIRDYLRTRGKALEERFAILSYDRLDRQVEAPGGPQIFAGLDQLTPAGRTAVVELYDQITRQQPGVPVLNDPRRSLLRPALLTRLADLGINQFQVYGADKADRVTRFPVFVREAIQHSGSLTGLLGSSTELRRALRALRLRGFRSPDLLVVEYCDSSDGEGTFRKFSAYKIGDAVVPAHMLAGRHWVMKSLDSERTLATVREDLAYVEENPHAAWLRRVFDVAGVDYGRIDYGVTASGPQVWEINLNPSLTRGPGPAPPPMRLEVAEAWNRAREVAHGLLRDAFVALERAAAPTRLRLRLEPELLARVSRESRARRRRGAALAFLRRLYGSRAGAPFRRLVGRFFPRP